MTTRKLMLALTFLAVFALAARVSIDNDTWWHLQTGRWIVEHGAVPKTDPFSYTRAGEPWKTPSVNWLVDVTLYLLYQILGPGGLNLWVAAMVTLAMLFVWLTLSGGEYLRAFVIVLATVVSAVYWAARPYMATFVFAAITLWLLEGYRWRGKDRLWWLPLLMLVWVNSHGGFVIGFLLWGVYFAGELLDWLNARWRRGAEASLSRVGRLALIGALMLVAATLNPSGPSALTLPFETVSIGALRKGIEEWQSPDFHELAAQPFLWLLLLTLAAVGFSKRRLAFTDFLLVTGFAYMGFLAGRNLALFALAAPPVLARHADLLVAEFMERTGIQLPRRTAQETPTWQRALNWAILVPLVAVAALRAGQVYPAEANWAILDEEFPAGALAALKDERPPGRLLNSYNWGGYLIWELPEYPVYVDGRTDLYGDELVGEWMRFVGAEEGQDGWEAIADKWDVRLVLLEPSWPVVAALAEAEGWQLLYQDELAVLYGR